MIYRITEDVERFHDIDHRDGNRQSYQNKYGNNGGNDTRDKKESYASGNTFESLARTNPELFNTKKLKAIQASKDLVKDFNEYIASIYGKDIDRFGRFVRSMETETNNRKITNSFYANFNVSFHKALFDRLNELIKEHDMPEDEAFKIATQEFFPESLDENGIKKVINTRIANNKCLTDSLTVMIKQNYMLLNMCEGEAAALINELNNEDTNASAIGKVKQILQNPTLLAKYKSGLNYDFRPIGGAVVILSDDNSIQFSNHPSKILNLICKYDAVVVAHGGDTQDIYLDTDEKSKEDKKSKKDIKIGSNGTANTSAKEIYKSDKEFNKRLSSVINTLDNIKNNLRPNTSSYREVTQITSQMTLILFGKRTETSDILEIIRDARSWIYSFLAHLKNTDSDKYNELKASLVDNINYCYNIYQTMYSKANPRQAIRDGKSANWVIQPVNTLSQKNLTRVVDILRALKKEGFKNVYLGACNTGHIDLPKDIRDDKNFKVTYGMNSSLIEDYNDPDLYELNILESQLDKYLYATNSPYNGYTLNELYIEYDNLCSIYHEGIKDSIKNFIKKAAQIIAEIWKRIVNFVKSVIQKIKEIVQKMFKDNISTSKTKKPVDVPTISIDGNNAKVEMVKCDTPEKIKEAIEKSNHSIQLAISYHAKREMDYMRKLNQILERNKYLNESTIFRYVVFI